LVAVAAAIIMQILDLPVLGVLEVVAEWEKVLVEQVLLELLAKVTAVVVRELILATGHLLEVVEEAVLDKLVLLE
jgi:hypothetical protein